MPLAQPLQELGRSAASYADHQSFRVERIVERKYISAIAYPPAIGIARSDSKRKPQAMPAEGGRVHDRRFTICFLVDY
ncbi:hypothetical protein [Nostoc sp.]|uniref:hypothetical protein n=1 Tax=Nostoc sp. TaxID=1180 RepID=UPI002FF85BD1